LLLSGTILLVLSLVTSAITAAERQRSVAANCAALVQELGTFPDALAGGAGSNGRLSELEERRETVYRELRLLDAAVAPALTRGLGDADVRVRRGVALYLFWSGAHDEEITPHGLGLLTLLDPLVRALRDPDERVREVSAHALGNVGAAAVVAVPDL